MFLYLSYKNFYVTIKRVNWRSVQTNCKKRFNFFRNKGNCNFLEVINQVEPKWCRIEKNRKIHF